MRKLTTAILVLSLVLGGVALAIAADVTPKNVDLNGLQKLTDQEAREVRGMGGGFGPSFGGFPGGGNPDCHLLQSTAIISASQTFLKTQTRDRLQDQSCITK